MDPTFFGLESQPFDRQSESRDSCLADAHASLIGELRAGLKAPHGITLLIGETGAGKTELARGFAERMAGSCTVAYLPSTGPGLRHLLAEIIEQLGGDATPSAGEETLLESLRSLTRARAEHERPTLVVIDEAHDLPAKTIERLGRLFGADPAEPSMLHIVLVGRPELLDRMNAASDRTILKHLVQVCRMDPIGPEESFRYIAERVAEVGGTVEQIFTEEALQLIVKRASGLPGKIDAICAAALDEAEGRGEASVGTETVDLACMGLEGFTLDDEKTHSAAGESDYLFDETQEEGESANHAAATRHGVTRKSPTKKLQQFYAQRRQLILSALALLAIVAGFAAVMTRSGQDNRATDRADLLAQTKGQDLPRAGQQSLPAQAASKTEARTALPTEPLAAAKLVVTREGAGAAAVSKPPARASTKPAAAAAAARSNVRTPRAVRKTAAPAKTSGKRAARLAKSRAATAKRSPATVSKPRSPSRVVAPSVAAVPAVPRVAASANPPAAVPAVPRVAASANPPAAVPATPRVAASANPPAAAPATPRRASPASSTGAAKLAKNGSAGSAIGSLQASVAGYYSVQIGAFRSRANADKLLTKLEARYRDAKIATGQLAGSTIFRVLSGRFSQRQQALQRAAKLKQQGFVTFVRSF